MPHEPTLTPPQRAEWASWMEGWRHLSTTDGLEGSSATVLAVNAYLHHLEADHARLVEENRRLVADRDHWKEHAEKEEEVSNRLSIDRNRYSRLIDALTGYIPRDLWWPEAEMSWFDALCAALGILKPDRVDAALTSPEAGREESGRE